MALASEASSVVPPFNFAGRDPKSPSSPNDAGADEVESPSIANTSTALARFEFEAGRGSHDGTKVLMVEWEDDDTTRGVRGDWHISWEGKRTVLPAADKDASSGSDIRRLYFLLPPGVSVPSVITLTHQPTSGAASGEAASPTVVWRTNPLPAIFPPELGASARAAGKKGVLHTIWAKRRLQVLQAEIDAESRSNVEGVGLMMVVQERDWIEQNFGVSIRPSPAAEGSSPGGAGYLGPSPSGAGAPPLSPSSPRSPGGGRLMDRLKGLKLSTGERDLASSSGSVAAGGNPLSPESSDVAVSSFSAIKGLQAASSSAEKSASPPPPQQRKVASQSPPASVLAKQSHSSGMASLDAFTGGGPGAMFKSSPATSGTDDEKEEQGLFALPMSPRSPEMTKSPFSFAVKDTGSYVGEKVA